MHARISRAYQCIRRRVVGTTLIELLGVMAVLAILATVAAGGVLFAQEKARISSAETSISAYRDAFISACSAHPGLVGDREAAWGADGSAYTSERGLQKLVIYMNEYLDGALALSWDPTNRYFKSFGTDPWGGYYILTDFPRVPGGTNYYDPTVPGNEGIVSASVWVTGNNDSILLDQVVGEKSYGACLVFKDGLGSAVLPGFEGETEFLASNISFK